MQAPSMMQRLGLVALALVVDVWRCMWSACAKLLWGARQSPSMYVRFTDRARTVMKLANQEAQRLNHEYIGTEHILLGLVRKGSGVAANVLKNFGVDRRTIRTEVEKIVQPGPEMVKKGRLPHTPRAKRVIECAIEEARNLKHNYVGTEHLLLGLLREQEGVAAAVLMNLHLKLDEVRDQILGAVNQVDDSGDSDGEAGESDDHH